MDPKKLFYEDLRAILVADYVANGKAEMDGEDLVISGKKGALKALDDFFGGMAVHNDHDGHVTALCSEAKGTGWGFGSGLQPKPRQTPAYVHTRQT